MIYKNYYGGGNCTLCNSPNTKKDTCPLNKDAKKPNPEKHFNAVKILSKRNNASPIAQVRKVDPSAPASPASSSFNEPFLKVVVGNFKPSNKIMAFDLDSTLITTKSGNKFPKNMDDWKLTDNSLVAALRVCASHGYAMVVFSNQGGIKNDVEKRKNMKNKFENVIKMLGISCVGYFATHDNEYRKPMMGMWKQFISDYNVNVSLSSSFYCGDAGSSKDFSQSDRMFANNIGLPFLYGYDAFLRHSCGKDVSDVAPAAPAAPASPTAPTAPTALSNKEPNVDTTQNTVFIMVGMPGSGKSYYAKKLAQQCLSGVVINQDTLKTRAKVFKVYKDLLSSKEARCIFIDRTNAKIEDRREFVTLAKNANYKTAIIFVKTDEDTSKYLNMYRVAQFGEKKIPAIVYNVYKKHLRENMPSHKEVDFFYEYTPSIDPAILNKYDFVSKKGGNMAGGGISPEDICSICTEVGPEEIENEEGQVEQVQQVQICPTPHYAHLGCITKWYEISTLCPECKEDVQETPFWQKIQENMINREYKPFILNKDLNAVKNFLFSKLREADTLNKENNYNNFISFFNKKSQEDKENEEYYKNVVIIIKAHWDYENLIINEIEPSEYYLLYDLKFYKILEIQPYIDYVQTRNFEDNIIKTELIAYFYALKIIFAFENDENITPLLLEISQNSIFVHYDTITSWCSKIQQLLDNDFNNKLEPLIKKLNKKKPLNKDNIKKEIFKIIKNHINYFNLNINLNEENTNDDYIRSLITIIKKQNIELIEKYENFNIFIETHSNFSFITNINENMEIKENMLEYKFKNLNSSQKEKIKNNSINVENYIQYVREGTYQEKEKIISMLTTLNNRLIEEQQGGQRKGIWQQGGFFMTCY